MTRWKYDGWTFDVYHYHDMLSYVMRDHIDDYQDEWVEWYTRWLSNLNTDVLFAKFTNEYLDEHSKEVHDRYKSEIQEIDDVPESCYDEDDELIPDYVKVASDYVKDDTEGDEE